MKFCDWSYAETVGWQWLQIWRICCKHRTLYRNNVRFNTVSISMNTLLVKHNVRSSWQHAHPHNRIAIRWPRICLCWENNNDSRADWIGYGCCWVLAIRGFSETLEERERPSATLWPKCEGLLQTRMSLMTSVEDQLQLDSPRKQKYVAAWNPMVHWLVRQRSAMPICPVSTLRTKRLFGNISISRRIYAAVGLQTFLKCNGCN